MGSGVGDMIIIEVLLGLFIDLVKFLFVRLMKFLFLRWFQDSRGDDPVPPYPSPFQPVPIEVTTDSHPDRACPPRHRKRFGRPSPSPPRESVLSSAQQEILRLNALIRDQLKE